MTALFLQIVNMSLAAGWVVLAVIVLRLVLKKAPKAMVCLLWGLVALRLLCPFSIESVFSLIPDMTPITSSSAPVTPSQNANGEGTVPTPSTDGSEGAMNAIPPTASLSGESGAATEAASAWGFWDAAAMVWLVGVGGMLIYSAVSVWRLRRRVCASVRRRDNLYICDDIDTPFILGVLRPRIYVPSALSPTQMDCVVAHEQAHLRRRDHWIKPFGFALLAVYWFHPLIWVAYILLCRDVEMACDERVIQKMDTTQKAQYSETLLMCSLPRRAVTACPLAFGEVGVKSRIRSVLSYKKPTLWIVLAAVAAIAVTAVCFLTDPLSDKAGAPKDGAVETVYRMAQSDDVTLCVQTPRFADNDILTAAVETAVAEKIGSLFETDSLRQVTAEQALQAATPHSFLLEYTVAHQEDARVDIVFEGVRTGETVTDVKYVHFVLNLEPTTGREVAFDRLYRADEALYRVFEAGLLQKYVPDSTDDGGETVIDEVCDMPAFLKGLKASAGYYWYGSENGVTIRAVVPYARGGYVETEIPANQLYPASTGTVIREPLTLTAAQMSYTADWKDRLEQVGLTDVQFSMAYGCTFGDLYILTNYYPYVETHRELQDAVLAVETEDTVWFASVGSAVFIEQLYVDDVTGDGVEDILIHADLGGSGGVGAYRSLVFEVTDSGLSLCFSHGGTVDEKDTGFRSRLSAPFQLTVENTQTGYVQTFDCSDKTAYVGTVFDSEGVPLIEEAVFDSGFSAFGPKDLDADGVCEIVTRTYVSVFTHTEYIGDGVAVFAYDREQQQFVVTKAAFDMIDDDITVYV